MKLKEKRLQRGVEQTQLAEKIGTNAPMVSNFERYKCLPVPEMLKAICRELGCEVYDIYEHDELFVETKSVHRLIAAAGRQEPSVYKLSVRLPDEARELLTQANLEKCGYHSLKDFVWHCYKRFEKQLSAIKAKENRPDYNSAAVEESDITTTNTYQ